MNYVVDWTTGPVVTLAALWQDYKDLRQEITTAQAEIDRVLARDPLGHGVHISEGLYALEKHPLRVLFEISEHDRLVTVTSVGLLV